MTPHKRMQMRKRAEEFLKSRDKLLGIAKGLPASELGGLSFKQVSCIRAAEFADRKAQYLFASLNSKYRPIKGFSEPKE